MCEDAWNHVNLSIKFVGSFVCSLLSRLITVYTRLLAALFYLEYGLYFTCSLYAQHTQRDKVFAWAITEFQSSSRTASAIWQWAKPGRSTVLIDELPSSDEEDFFSFEQ